MHQKMTILLAKFYTHDVVLGKPFRSIVRDQSQMKTYDILSELKNVYKMQLLAVVNINRKNLTVLLCYCLYLEHSVKASATLGSLKVLSMTTSSKGKGCVRIQYQRQYQRPKHTSKNAV